jgi:hypothetical protein
MEVTDDGPAISMFDEEGQKRLELGQTGGAWGIRLLESNEPVASLQLSHRGDSAGLEIRNQQGYAVMRPDGFSVQDTSNHGRAYLSLLNGNFPVLGISQNGQIGPPSVELTAGDSTRSLKLHDRDGHPLFSVVTAERGETVLSMRHPGHGSRAAAPDH